MSGQFNKDHIPESSIGGCVAKFLAYLILFGVPFGIGVLVGHFCW